MTSTVGIIGYPLGHSISPAFQQAGFDYYGMDVRYISWETLSEDLPMQMEALRLEGVLGANVTVPHKQAVGIYLNRAVEAVKRTGAVNTIVNRDGILEGHNTDTAGFLWALKEDGGFDASGKRVLLLGAGGAGRAVAYGLAEEGVASLTVANRTVERAQCLLASLGMGEGSEAIPLENSSLSARKGWDLVVNCTTLGMRGGAGEEESPLPSDLISSHSLVFDLVYNPQETPLLREARKAGACSIGGLPMLVYQGAESFSLWTGRDAPIQVMFQAARKALEAMV